MALEPLVYEAEEVAQLLCCTAHHIRDLAREGVIPSKRLGRRIVFPKAAIHTFIETPD